MTRQSPLARDEAMVRAAIEAAAAAGDADVPVGAVVFDAEGVELARAANAREAKVERRKGRRRR